jgi:electron transfer flavoprotein beta subunit
VNFDNSSSEFGVKISICLHCQILSVEDPPVRQAGAKVADVDELVAKLKEKGF